MKQIYKLSLLVLLAVVGGVNASAQADRTWNLITSNTYNKEDLAYDGEYREITDEGHPFYNLAFKGNVRNTPNNYLVIGRVSDNITSGIRIPATKGTVVKVTGTSPSTSTTFTWIGAELISGTFESDEEKTVVGISIAGESCSTNIKDYVTIENGRDNRDLLITKIEVYNPKDFKFEMPQSYDTKGYKIYDNGYMLLGDNRTPIPPASLFQDGISLSGDSPGLSWNPWNGVTYSLECKGNINPDKVGINPNTGQITGSIEGDGGAIVVKASYTQNGIEYSTEYVITVPYKSFEWDFEDTETKENLYANTSSIADWGLAWKVRYYSGSKMTQLSAPVLSNTVPVSSDNARFIDATAGLIFESPNYSFGTNTIVNPAYDEKSSDESVLTYARDNYNSANNVDSKQMNTAVTMQVGSTMTIPQLKQGQHIRIRWDRHYWDNGELMMAKNVTDLEGTSMTDRLFYVGSGIDVTWGHQEFIVEQDGDVSFTLVSNGNYRINAIAGGYKNVEVTGQQGWVNIKNIKISPAPSSKDYDKNFYFDTHMRPYFAEDSSNAMNNPKTFKDANTKEKKELTEGEDAPFYRDAIYTYIRKKGDPQIKTKLSLNNLHLHTQNGRQDAEYDITDITGKLNDKVRISNEIIKENEEVNGETKERIYRNLEIDPDAHGSFTLVLKSLHSIDKNSNDSEYYCEHRYLLDSIHVKVNVYEYDYNVKDYPYTWAMEHFTKDTGNNTLSELNGDNTVATWDKGVTTSYWTTKTKNEEYQFNVGYPENMIALKQRKTANANDEVFIPEFDGLGFIPEDYDDKKDKNVTLKPSGKGIILGGNKTYTLIVPEVNTRRTDDKKETVYLALKPNGNASVKVDGQELTKEGYKGLVYEDTYDSKSANDYNYGNGRYNKATELDIYKIEGKTGDVKIDLQNVEIHKVAVSVDTKKVTEVGYATEAREYPLDFTLAKTFLGREQKAYKVINVDDTGSQPNVVLSEVRYIPATKEENVVEKPEVNNGVIITGYDLQTGNKVSGGNSWPLFTTDIDRATSDMSSNKLVGVINPTGTDEKKEIIDQKDKIEGKDYYNYLLATGGYKVRYVDDKRTDANTETDEVVGTVEGLGFYLVLAKGTKIRTGVAYDTSEFDSEGRYKGGLPMKNSAYLKLPYRLAQINKMENEYEHETDAANSAGVHQVFFIDIDSILTGIDDVLTDDDEQTYMEDNNPARFLQNGVFYTLQGIPVKNPTKGIYIFNGKKVYVK